MIVNPSPPAKRVDEASKPTVATSSGDTSLTSSSNNSSAAATDHNMLSQEEDEDFWKLMGASKQKAAYEAQQQQKALNAPDPCQEALEAKTEEEEAVNSLGMRTVIHCETERGFKK